MLAQHRRDGDLRPGGERNGSQLPPDQGWRRGQEVLGEHIVALGGWLKWDDVCRISGTLWGISEVSEGSSTLPLCLLRVSLL